METNTENKGTTHELQTVKNEYLQMMPIQQVQQWYGDFVSFSKSILKQDLDFGVIPGTPKPSLYKAGAEKLRFVYGLGVELETIERTVDLETLFVDYTYRCTVKSKQGQILSQCEGNCNSLETKFGYVWKTVQELPEGTDISNLPSKVTGKKLFEFDFAINKSETSGQYGKPAEYWQMWKDAIADRRAKHATKKSKAGKDLEGWELDETVTVYRITNPDVIGSKNTIMKMAQKRAFVGAILIATGASEFFTQDIEDMVINGTVYSDDNPVDEIVEATVIESKTKTPEPPKQEPLPGHWYAKLERCKTPEDVDALAIQHKDTIQANLDLRKLFNQTKADIKKKKEVQHV